MRHAFELPKHVRRTPLNVLSPRKLKRVVTYYRRLMNDKRGLVNDLVLLLIHRIILLFVHTMLYGKLFLITTQQLYKMHVLESSLKRNQACQNRELILNKFVFQLISLYLYVGIQREDRNVRLVRRLVVPRVLVHHVLQGVVVQNLISYFLLFFRSKNFEERGIVKN